MEIVEIPLDEIKKGIVRARGEEAFARMRENVDRIGLKKPVAVRDIRHLPPSKRTTPRGGEYKYELVAGQGRFQLYQQRAFKTIPAVIVDASDSEVVGRFLNENIVRSNLSSFERAKLMEHDIQRGLSLEEIARKYGVRKATAKQYVSIVQKASPGVIRALGSNKLTLADASELVSFSKEQQEVIVDVCQDEGISGRKGLRTLVRQAKEQLRKTGRVSSETLRASLQNLREELRVLKAEIKSKTLHWTLSYSHIEAMVDDPEKCKLLESDGIDLSYFVKKLEVIR